MRIRFLFVNRHVSRREICAETVGDISYLFVTLVSKLKKEQDKNTKNIHHLRNLQATIITI